MILRMKSTGIAVLFHFGGHETQADFRDNEKKLQVSDCQDPNEQEGRNRVG